MVVCSVVVEVVEVWGCVEAQPDKLPMTETRRQERRNFFIYWEYGKREAHLLMQAHLRLMLGGCGCRRFFDNDFSGDHLITVLRVIDGHGSARFYRFT